MPSFTITTSSTFLTFNHFLVYGYGTASVAIISLLAILGLILFPVLESRTYKIIMQFFIGLATGTLSSDALIHIIPQVSLTFHYESKYEVALHFFDQKNHAIAMQCNIFIYFYCGAM